jgi:phosphopantetheinyl transferase (holo-ACP synthase)
VLVGDPDAAARAREIATAAGIVSEPLPYDRAVHTPAFAPFAEDLRGVFAELPVHAPRTPLWSCTTAAPYPDDLAQIRELLIEHWTSPVRFHETIEALHEAGARVFVEVGPRGNLTAFIEDILRGRPFCATASDVQRRSGTTQLNHLVALLAVHGVGVDMTRLFGERRAEEVDWREPRPEPEARHGMEVSLATAWPMIRLGDEVADRLRPRAAPDSNGWGRSEPPAAHAAAAAGASPGRGPAEPVLLPEGAAVVAAEPAPAPRAEPAPLAVAGPSTAADADEAAAVMEGHMHTMDRFLQAGTEIMRAYLTGAAPVTADRASRPLVGTIVTWQPGVELVAQRLFDPAEDRYLLDHTLGGAVSRLDPDLHALALMPLAMSLEILAEAAACLVPGLLVTGLRAVRAHRWLAWDGGPQTLELRARLVASDELGARVHTELRTLEDDGAGPPAVEAEVLLHGAYPAAPPPLETDLRDGRPSRWPPGQLYGEAMFHGDCWQAVRTVDVLAPAAALARLEALPPTGLLSSDPAPELVLDPVLLDAAGQVIGFWAADRLERARVVFPFRLAALDVYGPAPAAGRALECRAAIEPVGDEFLRSDIDVLDETARPWMRLTGWEDKRFDVPERLRPLTVPSELAPLSAPWDAALDAPAGLSLACRRLHARLPLDAGLWERAWASRVLGRRERELFAALQLPQGRRLEWLAARTAAKEALAELLRAAGGPKMLPADIEILPDADGRPLVTAPGAERLGRVPVVSLAHAQGEAVALAALAPTGSGAELGIDIEHLSARPPGFAEAALGPGERRLLDGLPPELRDEWLLRLWCAKEAAGKGVGSGMAPGRPEAPVAVSVEADRQQTVVQAAGRRITVRTRRDGDLVVAATVIPDAEERR